jgi:hypothetical protein
MGQPGRPAGTPDRLCWRDDLVTALLNGWLMMGLFIDGWAHNTRHDRQRRRVEASAYRDLLGGRRGT